MPLPFDPQQLKSVVNGLLDEHLADLAREGATPEMCGCIRGEAHRICNVLVENGELSYLAFGIVGLAAQQLLENNV